MAGSIIAANQAAGPGAGLLIVNADQVTVSSSSVDQQTFKSAMKWWNEQSGAGIYASNIGRFQLLDSSLTGNHAHDSGGGAVFSDVMHLGVMTQSLVITEPTIKRVSLCGISGP